MCFSSDSSYVQLYRRNSGGTQQLTFVQVGGSGSAVSITLTATSMYMRLVKSGSFFTAYYKINSGDAWTTLGTVTYAGGGAIRFFSRSTVTCRFDYVSFASGFATAATVQVKGASTLYLDAGSSQSFDWSEWAKTLTSGTTCRARYDWSDDSGATPSYGSWLSWDDFIAQTNTASDKRYIWLQLELTYASGQASLDDVSYATYSLDTTPPAAPSSTETSTPQGKTYTLVNWAQPADADFDHCELRRTKSGSHEYLANSSGSQAWQASPTTYWKIREGAGGAGISPASAYLDESITSVTAYAVRSVDALNNASAWTACTAVTPTYCNASDVRYGVDRGDGTTGTCRVPTAANVRSGTNVDATTGSLAVPATNKVLSGEAVDNTTGTLTLPAVGNVLSGISYGVGGNGSTGTFDEASRNTDPGVANVLEGTSYKILNTTYTGTLISGSGAVFPGEDDVLTRAVAYGPNGNDYVGNATLPAASDVLAGVMFGASGTEFEGTATGGGGDAPSVPTLTVSDNGDNTGAVATIADADSGTTNTVYVADYGSSVWALAGSRTGNGTVALDLDAGVYSAYVVSSNGQKVVSSIVVFSVTTGAETDIDKILTAMKAMIDGENYHDANGDLVETRTPITEYPIKWINQDAAGIVILPEGDPATPNTTGSNSVTYNITVAISESLGTGTEATFASHAEMRQAIRRLFLGKRLTTFADAVVSSSTASEFFSQDQAANQLAYLPISFEVEVVESRE